MTETGEKDGLDDSLQQIDTLKRKKFNKMLSIHPKALKLFLYEVKQQQLLGASFMSCEAKSKQYDFSADCGWGDDQRTGRSRGLNSSDWFGVGLDRG
ncbi:hypothetical protein HPP92_023612 [Vanilla planifolia]|uniref:Uncharacterized protein n=1 Tax=Vanilla planifolia TaxID=51239 RepID=A0A835PM36_VANPL|nr:hypothetical protein HPP92_023612 [Vanilla planifolia]